MQETEIRKKISDWVSGSGEYSVYWGEGGSEQYPNYQMDSTGDRPDMLAQGDSNILIEIKNGDDSSLVYDGMAQCQRYWSQIEFGDATALIDGNRCSIDAVALMTQYSSDGRLFKEEREQGQRQTYSDHESDWNKNSRPQYEYARTEAVPRIMWRYAWYETEHQRGSDRNEIKTSIGIVLSGAADQPTDQSRLGHFYESESASEQKSPKFLVYDGDDRNQWGQ